MFKYSAKTTKTPKPAKKKSPFLSIFFDLKSFFFMCMHVLPTYVCAPCETVRRGIRFLGSGVTESSELPSG